MELNQPLEAYLLNKINEFDYYRKRVSVKIIKSGSSTKQTINLEGDINGFSTDGSITLSNIIWNQQKEQDEEKKIDHDDDKKIDCDFHIKSIVEINLDLSSIKNVIFDIINYKTIQQILYHTNLKELNIENRRKIIKIINSKSDDAKIDDAVIDDAMIANINNLDINVKIDKNDNNLRDNIIKWINDYCKSNKNLYDIKNIYDINDIKSLLISYHNLWKKYITKNIINIKKNEIEMKEKTYSSYIQWDNWNRNDDNNNNNDNNNNDKANNIYLKSLWPHSFHGPYHRSLSSNPDWRCMSCNKQQSISSNIIKTPYKNDTETIILSKEMKEEINVKSALCIIPPQSIWPQIQKIRKKHDPAYIRWMPHLNIFFPFIDEKHFDQIANYIYNEIIIKNKIKSFMINLEKFDIFEKVKDKFNNKGKKSKNKGKESMETMFLKPDNFGISRLKDLFEKLKPDWKVCADKHDNGQYNPHLTCGKFKLNEIKKNVEKYNNFYENNKISFQCKEIYLISRKGDNPFEIKYKIPFIDNKNNDKKIKEIVITNKNKFIKYYKTKKTSFTYEICYKCIEKKEKEELDKNVKKIENKKDKQRATRKKYKEKKEKQDEEFKFNQDRNTISEIIGLPPRSPIELNSGYINVINIKFDKYGKKSEIYNNGQLIKKIKSGFNTIYSNYEINLNSKYQRPCIYRWEIKLIKNGSCYFGIDSSNFHYINGDYAVTGNISDLYSFGPSCLYSKKKGGTNYGKKGFKEGDIVKMEINTLEKIIEFFINDESQGIAFKDEEINIDKIYNPAISINGKDDEIKIINFEQEFV